MITKAELERLRAAQPTMNRELHYTIGGAVEQMVHSSVEAERIGQLTRGDRQMQKALEELRWAQAFKTREGLAKAQFNANTQSISPAMGS